MTFIWSTYHKQFKPGNNMYKLYYQPGTASFVVHWLLIELEIPHELELIDFSCNQQKSTEYLKINPAGVVPTLLINNNYISEFAGICMYIIDKHAPGVLAPVANHADRAAYNQWMFYVSNTIQPTFRNWFYAEEFGTPELTKNITQKKLEAIFTRCDLQMNDGRPYFLGDQLTAVDFLITMIMRWSRNMPKPADQWPNLGQLAAKMKQMDSFKTLNHQEGLTDWN